jgi:hypothetical protein
MNFVPGQIPRNEGFGSATDSGGFGLQNEDGGFGLASEGGGFGLATEGGGFGNFPSHTLVENNEKMQPVVGTDEDRDSKGIGGLLELAGSKYIMDQIGEEFD